MVGGLTELSTAAFGVAPRAVYTGMFPAVVLMMLPLPSTPIGVEVPVYIGEVAVSRVNRTPEVPATPLSM